MRNYDDSLHPCAARSSQSKGRQTSEAAPQFRSQYQRDRDRIVHSAAFRRLEYKTQVFVNHEGDLFRTRMTHTIEVAQIARSVARTLALNEDLTEAIALAHDLGHTPFGHAGQQVLDKCMRDFGGFEHNLQSLRVVDKLEEKYAEFRGLNLCYETREGILKHCSIERAKKLGDIGERFLSGGQPGLEAQLTDLADQIAYNCHDVDDGLRAGLIEINQLGKIELFQAKYSRVKSEYPELSTRRTIHEIVRRMVNQQIVDLVAHSRTNLENSSLENPEEIRHHSVPLIAFSEPMREMNNQLKHFLRNHLYRHYRVHRMSIKAEKVIEDLFGVFVSDPKLLPPEPAQRAAEELKAFGNGGRARAIADYIAGMTDRYAIAEHERLFNPARTT